MNAKLRGKIIFIALLAGLMPAAVFFLLRPSGTQHTSTVSQTDPLVRAELLANVDAIVPGRELLIGIKFRIAPQWYIYWKDPGDAGLPTTADLKLPEGFAAGSVLYPDPMRFQQPGDIVGYGYKEEAMLLARVYPPAELVIGGNAALQVHARWLACRDQCILGEQHLVLNLPVAPRANAANEALFGKWQRRIPEGLESPGSVSDPAR